MSEQDLIKSVEKHTGMSQAEAASAVKAVLGTLRSSDGSALILRKAEGKIAPADKRKIVHLCG